MSHHVPYKFVPNSYFYYLTGIVQPSSIYVLDIDLNNEAIKHHLFIEEGNDFTNRWEGPRPSTSDCQSMTGIDCVSDRSEFKKFMSSFFTQSKQKVVMLWKYQSSLQHKVDLPYGIDHEADVALHDGVIEADHKQIQLCDPFPIIDLLRREKSDYELECLHKASEVISQAFVSCMQLKPSELSAESNVAALVYYEARKRGCELAYPPVVANGVRTNIIHYMDACESASEKDLLLMDAGCRVEGYMSDITRTWPISGTYSPQQRVLQDILATVQEDCVKVVSPETSLQNLYHMMLSRLVQYLSKEGIIPVPENPLQAGAAICPHHVGHYLGLDIHDTPSISYSESLKPRTVFPIEPGVYFPPDGQKQTVDGVAKEFRGLGLRLEDDFFVNGDGKAQKLCSLLPSTASDIEALMAGKT